MGTDIFIALSYQPRLKYLKRKRGFVMASDELVAVLKLIQDVLSDVAHHKDPRLIQIQQILNRLGG